MSDKQKGVNKMAVAIARAEMETESLMVLLGKLPDAIRDFRKECDLHASKTAIAQMEVGSSLEATGKVYAHLRAVHDALSCIVKDCDLPEPGPAPNSGGGGGK